MLPAQREATDVLRTAIEQAARAVALEMLRDRAALEGEARLRREFLDDLLNEHPVPIDVLRHRARQVWHSFSVPHRPFIGRISCSPEVSNYLERARETIADSRPGDFVSIYGDRLIGLLPISDPEEVQVSCSASCQRSKRTVSQPTSWLGASVATWTRTVG